MKGKINNTDDDIDIDDIDIFSKLKEKIDGLMNNFNQSETKINMEDYLGSFKEELELMKLRKNDAKRINEFIEDLRERIHLKLMRRQKIQEKFCNAVNYESVNHMNILNKI
jgi:hypothetical protein